MQMKQTDRGFMLASFKDGNGHECSIQESSACRDEGLIWLGIDRPEVKTFGANGWQDVPLPEDVLLGGRMHLTQSQVRELLPLLQHFAECGDLRLEQDTPGTGCPCCRRESLPDSE